MENPQTRAKLKARAKFWAEAERIGLDSKMVHHEWDVESMKDTKADAKASLRLLEIIEYALKRKIGLHGLHQATGILRAVELIGTKKTWGQLKAQIDAYEAPSS